MAAFSKEKIRTGARRVIQVAFFIAIPGVFSAAFSGVRGLATIIGCSEPVVVDSFLLMLIFLLAHTIVFGRFFCGYACAFGTLGDWIFNLSVILQKKLFKKTIRFPERIDGKLRYTKYALLTAILVMCYIGCYDKVSCADPWELFAGIISGNFSWKIAFIPSAVILLFILIGMSVKERFFCRYICPMGAIFSLMPVLPISVIARDKDKCLGNCRACNRICPCNLTLEDDSGECIQCGKCISKCPAASAGCGIKKVDGNEVWAVAIKAILLYVLIVILI